MLNVNAILLGLALGLTQVNGHFLLNYPTPIGPFDEDTEGNTPCGGATPSLTNATDFHIGGDVISVQSTHPEAKWFFRATTDPKAAGGWVNILPEIQETGLGLFCEQDLTLPSEFAGKQGYIQVSMDAVDGDLFQCAAVNFVSGAAPSVPSSCKNATGLTASVIAAASDPTSSGAPSKTSAAPAATSSGAAMAIGADVFGALGATAMSFAALFALVL